MWFSAPAYASAMAGYLKAKGESQTFQDGAIAQEILDKARAYAIKEAQKATYRDFNAFSDFIASVGRKQTNNPAARAAGMMLEGVLPFRRTPANILVRGFEYSPFGFFHGIYQAAANVRKGETSAAEAIDNIASGLTGTGLMALGAFLTSIGMLSPGEDDDEKQEGFDDLRGGQNYAINVGRYSFTIDWLAPECLPVFVGAEIYDTASSREGVTFKAVLNGISSISEPMLEMSFLSGLNDALESIEYADNKLVSLATTAAVSYLSQGLPTLFGQIERVGEREREQTYIYRNHWLPDDMQYILGKAMNKTPGEFNQIPYIDAWGRREETGDVALRVLNNMLNPAFISRDVSTEFDGELQRLYDEGYSNVFPQRVSQSQQVQEEYLKPEQYVAYAEVKGKTQYEVVQEITSSEWYENLNDFDRAEHIGDAYTYANAMGKQAADGTFELEGWVREAQAGKDRGISVAEYIYAYNNSKDLTGKDSSGETVANLKGLRVMAMVNELPGLSQEQREYLYQCFGVGKTVIGYSSEEVEKALKEMEK